MRSLDVQAHLMPQRLWQALDAGLEGYGVRYEPGQGSGVAVPQDRLETLLGL